MHSEESENRACKLDFALVIRYLVALQFVAHSVQLKVKGVNRRTQVPFHLLKHVLDEQGNE